jgi:hypothetical protein
MARYVASVIFADGDQIQTIATGDTSDHLHGVLRHEATLGAIELIQSCRVDADEAAEACDTLRALDDE